MFKKVFIIVVLLLLVITSGNSQPSLTDLRFFLSYIPNIQFSPIYVPMAKGYFAEEGYNLVVEYGDENVGVEQIAVGDLPFGMVSGEQVILARANGRPIVYIYEWFQKFPIAIVIPSTTEASTVAELAGQRVGIPGRFGASYSGLTAVLAANEMTESDIQLEAIGFNAPDIICAGAVSAAVVYINNEPLQIQDRADAGECGDVTGVTVIPLADTVNMISNGVATSEKMVTEDPEQVAAVTRAFDRGLRDVINNPAEAYLLTLDYVENLPMSDAFREVIIDEAGKQKQFLATSPDREAIVQSRADLLTRLEEQFTAEELGQFRVLLATIELWDDDELGVTEEEGWTLTQDVLLQMGMIPEAIDLKAAYTNEFVPTLPEN